MSLLLLAVQIFGSNCGQKRRIHGYLWPAFWPTDRAASN